MFLTYKPNCAIIATQAKNTTKELIMQATTNYQLRLSHDNINKMVDAFIGTKYQKCERTLKTYSQGITYFLRYLSDAGISDPKQSDLNNYIELLISGDTNKGIKPKSDTTINSYLTSIRQFFSWAESSEIYPNIAKGFNNIDIESRHRKDALTPKQARLVLDSIDTTSVAGIRDYAIINLLMNTGLRTIEVERANICDIDIIEGYHVLRVQGKGCRTKSQYVKLTNSVYQSLDDYLSVRPDEDISDDAPLFTSLSHRHKGNRLTTRSISRIVKQTLRNAGFDSTRLTAHSLRHTAATIALEAGVPAREVQKMTRHKDAKTLELYAHDKKRLTDSAEDAIEAVLSGFCEVDNIKVISFNKSAHTTTYDANWHNTPITSAQSL